MSIKGKAVIECYENLQSKILAWNEQSCDHCRKEMLTGICWNMLIKPLLKKEE